MRTNVSPIQWGSIALLCLFSFLICILCSPAGLRAQPNFAEAHPGLEFRVVGAGQTTNRIGVLYAYNSTSGPITIEAERFLIPPTGDYQAYIATIAETVVPPYTESTIIISGRCLDIYSPPVPDGAPFTGVETWIAERGASSIPLPGVPLPAGSAFEETHTSVEASGGKASGSAYTLSYPGRDIPFPYSIDFNRNILEASGFLFEMEDRIQAAFDSLWEAGAISTPLPPHRAPSEITQQTIWHITALLQNDPYTKEDFSGRMAEQLETNLGKPLEEAPESVQQQFHEGVDQIWDAIETVGLKGKLLTEKGETTPAPVEEGPEDKDERLKCRCDSLPFSYLVRYFSSEKDTFGILKSGSAVVRFNGQISAGQEINVPAVKSSGKKVDISNAQLLALDFKFGQLMLHCSCREGEHAKEDCKCDEIFGARTGGDLAFTDEGRKETPMQYSEKDKLDINVKESKAFKVFKPSDAEKETNDRIAQINAARKEKETELNKQAQELEAKARKTRKKAEKAELQRQANDLMTEAKAARDAFDARIKAEKDILKKRKEAIAQLRNKYWEGWYRYEDDPNRYYGTPAYFILDATTFSLDITITGFCKGAQCGGDKGGAKCEAKLHFNFPR